MGSFSALFAAAAVLRSAAATSSISAGVSVTPAPCNGADPSACPYYYTKPADSFYQVFINGQQSFIYQAETPAKCKTGHINCARHCERQRIFSAAAGLDMHRYRVYTRSSRALL